MGYLQLGVKKIILKMGKFRKGVKVESERARIDRLREKGVW